MIDELLSTAIYFIFFLAIFVTIIWITGFIGSLITSVGEMDKEQEEKEVFLIIAWVVACLALAALVCSLIFGG